MRLKYKPHYRHPQNLRTCRSVSVCTHSRPRRLTDIGDNAESTKMGEGQRTGAVYRVMRGKAVWRLIAVVLLASIRVVFRDVPVIHPAEREYNLPQMAIMI